ncbi:MAG TPA: sulfatase-like hydrolase/transferase [Candidatus Paceibacterota bacterium]|nr:sulfatase-like hydrolase/transferase [Verrucomicrobiota bacterium]HSA09452.1 sulfatase-like hydrolase/transferase [Candidatus Paceibacterota bacterium]
MKPITLLILAALLPALPAALQGADAARPNILWLSCEDTSPWLGFCGEKYASTPTLDRLARGGVHYNNAFATAPVCSPSRFAIITGCYATTYGTQRLRSRFPVPHRIEGFPAFLRHAGYYCSNNTKTDYNTRAQERIISAAWNECSGRAHWRNRKPGQPFFAVFNLTETHQGQVFESAPPKLAASQRHDPSRAPLPPYYPDTPTARRTIARVHDCISAMDQHAGEILAELERDGLRDDTIVFFWPDHGQGIPRGKRTLWDTGLKIPLVVYFPEKYLHLAPAAAGSVCDRMVSLVDLGPTLLSLLELPIPAHMQGRAFLGKASAAPREYVFGARDRVDEALELCRSIRDPRYLYLRSYMPHLSWNQPEAYSDQLALRREITRLAAEGKLNAPQLTYAGPCKPVEALYDSEKDPWQIRNLADDPASRPVLERMRKALRDWQIETRDLGFIHEWQAEMMCAAGLPMSKAAHSDKDYPLERVLDTADRVGRPGQASEFIRRLSDADPTVRYWAANGLRSAGREAAAGKDALRKALADESVPVRVEAAGVLVAQFSDGEALQVLTKLLQDPSYIAATHAARTLELLGEKARPAVPAMLEALAANPQAYVRNSLSEGLRALGLEVDSGNRPGKKKGR